MRNGTPRTYFTTRRDRQAHFPTFRRSQKPPKQLCHLLDKQNIERLRRLQRLHADHRKRCGVDARTGISRTVHDWGPEKVYTDSRSADTW